MSFSKQFRGSAAVVLAAIAALPAEQRAADAGSSPGVIEGHAKQIAACVPLVEAAVSAAPEGAELLAGMFGHANPDESGNYGYSVQVSGLSTPPVASVD